MYAVGQTGPYLDARRPSCGWLSLGSKAGLQVKAGNRYAASGVGGEPRCASNRLQQLESLRVAASGGRSAASAASSTQCGVTQHCSILTTEWPCFQ